MLTWRRATISPDKQRNAAAVQRDTGEADACRALALQNRRAAGEDEFCRAANADELRAALQPKHPAAIDARRQGKRALRARSLVDRALQGPGLVVGTAGPHAILRDIAAERGSRRRSTRGLRRHRKRAGGACSNEMAAV